MNKVELAQLLTVVSGFDNRKVTPDTVEIWFPLLQDIESDIALAAVQEHYRNSREWLMPSDIRAQAKRMQERLDREERRMRPALPRPEITFDRAEFDRMVAKAIEENQKGRSDV